MTDEKRWLDLLQATGAVQSGDFLLSSGRHSGRYVQCAKVLENPANAETLGAALAASLPKEIDRVASPPLGGILIGYEVARALGRPFLFPERGPDGRFQLRRGFTLRAGERICIVEDVVTTGRTTRELIDLVRGFGAEPVCSAAIVDRSETHAVEGMPIHALVHLSIPTYTYSECPLCALGTPLYQPGSRKDPTKRGPNEG
ncbi:MAG: orotate phosphoribosyltransferase [Thermotogota bacterium]